MFDWIDWKKLRREWKTAALAVVSFIIEGYDGLVAMGFINLPAIKPSFLPPEYQPLFSPAIWLLMLLLRKWKDANVVHQPSS